MQEGQSIPCQDWFLPSTMCVLGLELRYLRSSVLEASIFSNEQSSCFLTSYWMEIVPLPGSCLSYVSYLRCHLFRDIFPVHRSRSLFVVLRTVGVKLLIVCLSV